MVAVFPAEATGMLSRPLVYTALTRAQRHLSVVHGAGPALARAVADGRRAAAGDPAGRAARRGRYLKMTVRRPCSRMRCSACQRTARASATRSVSRPSATSWAGAALCSTRATSCSMIGPSSSSAVT